MTTDGGFGADGTGEVAGIIFLDPYNGGLSAIRSLRRQGHKVIVIAGLGNPHIVHTRGVEGHKVPFAPDGEPWFEILHRLGERGPHVVITGGDVASAWLAEQRHRLPPNIRSFEMQDEAHLSLMRKDDANALAERAGVAVPWTREVATAEALEDAVADAPWPCVVKPVLSHEWRAIFGEDRVLLVHDAAEARRAAAAPLERGLALILTEYIPGGDADVEEAIVVRAADGSFPVQFGCKKIRQFPVGFGAASLCQVDELEESMALARAVLDEAGFVGVAGVETKRHAETGKPYFLEVNVRIPTQWGLGDAAGLEASSRLVATLRGEQLDPQPPIRHRARLVFVEREVRAALAALSAVPARERFGVGLRLARSYGGTRDVGVLDPRDPGPGLALMRHAIGRRIRVPGRGRPT